MKKQLLYRAAAATVLGLSLTTGVAAAQTPYQYHKYRQMPTTTTLTSSLVANHNTVNATNKTNQVAQTGNAVTVDNRSGGDPIATSGDANNTSNLTNASVDVSTTGSTSGNAGVDSTDDMPTSTTPVSTQTVTQSAVVNTNDVTVTNNTNQYASTGNAVVAHNGTGGSATSGTVNNTSTASFSVEVND